MLNQLPEFVDPIRLAEMGQVLKGQVAVADMPRLAAALGIPGLPGQIAQPLTQGEVDADLVFGVDGQGIRYVRGRLRAELNVMCQRCLQPMILPLQVNISLGMAQTLDAAERLPDGYEPLMVPLVNVQPQPHLLAAIIEDELLLALPVAPMHAVQCLPRKDALVEVVAEALPSEGKKRPFAELAQLQKLKKKS